MRDDSSSTDLIEHRVENRLLSKGEPSIWDNPGDLGQRTQRECREQLLSHRRGNSVTPSVQDSSWNIPQPALSWKSKYSPLSRSHGHGLLSLRAVRKQPNPTHPALTAWEKSRMGNSPRELGHWKFTQGIGAPLWSCTHRHPWGRAP